MGFEEQIKDIFRYTAKHRRQVMMFSATFPRKIISLARRYLHNPVRVNIGRKNATNDDGEQELMTVYKDHKFKLMKKILHERPGTFIIFVRTQKAVEGIENKLSAFFPVVSIHGGYTQEKRLNAIRTFKAGGVKALIATDVAARGLDIPHVDTVLNYDLPEAPENYVHRIGRTGRAGNKGYAISFLTAETVELWENVLRFLAGKKVRSIKKKFEKFDKKKDPNRKDKGEANGNVIRPPKERPNPFASLGNTIVDDGFDDLPDNIGNLVDDSDDLPENIGNLIDD
jgi:superfamily II DNA/RNA helicase